jgi:hypothetical protein
MDEEPQRQLTQIRGLPNARLLLRYMVLFYVFGTAVYFIYNGLQLATKGVKQKVSLVTHRDRRPLALVVQPAVGKPSLVVANSKPSRKPVKLNRVEASCNERLPVATDNPDPIFSANTKKETYLFCDTTAQFMAVLNYSVSTTLSISTIN